MDVGAFLDGVGTIDLLIVLYFMGFFVLGFAQGTIRRLIGIGSILFSWFLAALLAAPLSEFLGDNWTQFSRQYSYMVGFGTVFVASVIAFALVTQSFYKPQPLSRRRAGPTRSSAASWACSRRPSSSALSWSSSTRFSVSRASPSIRRSCRSCARSGTPSTARRSARSSATR